MFSVRERMRRIEKIIPAEKLSCPAQQDNILLYGTESFAEVFLTAPAR
jgi:hypothetical protein